MSDAMLSCDEGLNLYNTLIRKNAAIQAENNKNLAQYMYDLKNYNEAKEYHKKKHREWETKTGDFDVWKREEDRLKVTPFVNKNRCELWNQVSGERHDDWCPTGFYHNGGTGEGCILSRGAPVCFRTEEQVQKDLIANGYAAAEPVFDIEEPVKPVDKPQNKTSAIITCCNNEINLNNSDAINLIQECQNKIAQSQSESSSANSANKTLFSQKETALTFVTGSENNYYIIIIVIFAILLFISISSSIALFLV